MVFAIHHFKKTLKSFMHGVFQQLLLKFGKIFKVEFIEDALNYDHIFIYAFKF
jgi:hypothetical protein